MVNIHYSLQYIAFEWDSEKADANVHKHTVTFESACEAFFDPFVIYLNDEVIEGETRETIIGLTTKWQLLYVVYILREEIIRIISARPATSSERKTYEDQ